MSESTFPLKMSESTHTIYDIILNQLSDVPYWTPMKCLVVLIPEIAAPIIFAISIYVMNKGVEIGHPVYAVLFLNLIFPCLVTVIMLSASFVLDIAQWKVFAGIGNMISMLYHHSCWAVLSVLR